MSTNLDLDLLTRAMTKKAIHEAYVAGLTREQACDALALRVRLDRPFPSCHDPAVVRAVNGLYGHFERTGVPRGET